MSTFPTAPATNLAEATSLIIDTGNRNYNILVGDINTVVETVNGDVPSIRKAIHEMAVYKSPLAWSNGTTQTDLLQPRSFNGHLYVPTTTPALMGVAPAEPLWALWKAAYVSIQWDDGVATEGQTSVTFSGMTYVPGGNNLSFYVNGSLVSPSNYTESSDTTIVLDTGMEAGDEWFATVNARAVSSDVFLSSNVTYTKLDGTTVNLDGFLHDVEAGIDVTSGLRTWSGTTDGTAYLEILGANTDQASAYIVHIGSVYQSPETAYTINTTLERVELLGTPPATGIPWVVVGVGYGVGVGNEAVLDSFNAALNTDLTSVDYCRTLAYTSGSNKGGASFYKTGNTGTASTPDLANGVFYDAAGNEFGFVTDQQLNVCMFGAVGDVPYNGLTGTDDSPAIQSALNYAASNVNKVSAVYVPAGGYLLGSTVYIPEGIRLFGDGVAGNNSMFVTEFVQGHNGDAFGLEGHQYGTRYWWFGILEGFKVRGNPSYTAGFGINCEDSSGHSVALQDTTIIRNINCYRFYEGGINVQDAGLPIYFSNINCSFNGGPGITITSKYFNNGNQSIDLFNISGDGNNGGLIKLSQLDNNGNVNIYNLKSEAVTNSFYGGDYQRKAIDIDNCAGLILNVFGATHISAIPDGSVYEKPGSLIYLDSSSLDSEVRWNGVAIRVRGTDTGADPGVIETASGSASTKVHYYNSSGHYSGNRTFLNLHWSANNTAHTAIGPVNSYQNGGNEFPGFQVAGGQPAYSLHDINGGTNEKTWINYAHNSSKSLRRATVDDSGTADVYETVTRSGGGATKISWDIRLANTGMTAYADNAAAIAGGLSVGDIYHTSSGDLRIVV